MLMLTSHAYLQDKHVRAHVAHMEQLIACAHFQLFHLGDELLQSIRGVLLEQLMLLANLQQQGPKVSQSSHTDQ